jgi:hypothetical protein
MRKKTPRNTHFILGDLCRIKEIIHFSPAWDLNPWIASHYIALSGSLTIDLRVPWRSIHVTPLLPFGSAEIDLLLSRCCCADSTEQAVKAPAFSAKDPNATRARAQRKRTRRLFYLPTLRNIGAAAASPISHGGNVCAAVRVVLRWHQRHGRSGVCVPCPCRY